MAETVISGKSSVENLNHIQRKLTHIQRSPQLDFQASSVVSSGTYHLILAYIRKCHPFQEPRELLSILKILLFKVTEIHTSVYSLELR